MANSLRSATSPLAAIHTRSAGIFVPTWTGLHARARRTLEARRAVLCTRLRGRGNDEGRGKS